MWRLVLLAVATAAVDVKLRPGTRVKYGEEGIRGTDYYRPIPKCIAEAKSMGWKKTARPDGPMPYLVMYCPRDYEVCVLFDDTGYIAGAQIALNKNKVKNAAFDWKTQGYTEWTVNRDTFWAITQYFVDEEYLSICAEDRLETRDETQILQLDYIWLTSFYGKLLRVPVDESEIDETDFDSQACVTGMGHHYFYNLTNTVCKSDLILPWFVLYYEGRLVASLWASFAELPLNDGQQDWFERPGQAIIQKSFPNASTCLGQLSTHTISLHMWFIDNPWDVVCK